MFLGIEIGGTKLQLVLGNDAGKIEKRLRRKVDPAKGAAGIREQIAAALLVAVYAFVVTFIILKVLDRFEPVRVPDSVEQAGLDTELEEEQAYILN